MSNNAPSADRPPLGYKPGERLRQARESAGLELAEIAEALKLSPAMTAALEADDYDGLPEPVFVRGYMKRYAAQVGLPPEEIAERFDEYYQADTGRSPDSGLRPNPVRVLADMDGVSRRVPRFRRRRGVMVLLVLAGGVLLYAGLGDLVRSGRWSGLALPTGGTATVPVQSQSLPGAVSVPSSRDLLVLAIQADCQVFVRDAEGRELATGAHKPGEELRLEGISPFSIELRPASAVRLRFNGQDIDLGPYTVNDIVNFRLSR